MYSIVYTQIHIHTNTYTDKISKTRDMAAELTDKTYLKQDLHSPIYHHPSPNTLV